MFVNFNDWFHKSIDEAERLRLFIKKLTIEHFLENGKDCVNCKHKKHVQCNAYNDYLTCKLDESIEIDYGLYRHFCEKWELDE